MADLKGPASRLDRQGVTRRTVTRTAAWSVPVVLAVAAAPMAAASPNTENVSITSSCYGLNILGFGMSFPQFHFTAVNAPIDVGSTFLLTGSGLANLTIGGLTGIFDFKLLSSGSAVLTVRSTISAGSTATIQVTGLASAQVLTTYTVSVQNIIGNANTTSTDDSAMQSLTGMSVFGILLGRCS